MSEEPNKPAFDLIKVNLPHLEILFLANPERIKRISDFILKEADESSKEFEQIAKAKPSQP